MKWTVLEHIRSTPLSVGPCHHRMTRPQGADGATASNATSGVCHSV